MIQIPLHHLHNGSVTYTRPGTASKGLPKLPFLKKQELTPRLAWEGGSRLQYWVINLPEGEPQA